MIDKTIGELFAELTDAEQSLSDAQRETNRARNREAICLNRVNKVQKEIDEKMSAAKAAASSSTDWGHARAVVEIREPK